MVESIQEIDKNTYNRLLNNYDKLQEFGRQVAKNSFFKPHDYGFFGCKLFYNFNDHKYYIKWKHREKDYEKTFKGKTP